MNRKLLLTFVVAMCVDRDLLGFSPAVLQTERKVSKAKLKSETKGLTSHISAFRFPFPPPLDDPADLRPRTKRLLVLPLVEVLPPRCFSEAAAHTVLSE